MSFFADLALPGVAEYLEVSELQWGIAQRTGAQHTPLGGILVGQVRVVLGRLTHPVIADWMANAHKKLDGKVRIHRPDGLGVARTIEFEQAHCFHQGLLFNSTGTTASSGMSFLISAQTLRIDGAVVLSNGERPS